MRAKEKPTEAKRTPYLRKSSTPHHHVVIKESRKQEQTPITIPAMTRPENLKNGQTPIQQNYCVDQTKELQTRIDVSISVSDRVCTVHQFCHLSQSEKTNMSPV
jgi:hypothetical protein